METVDVTYSNQNGPISDVKPRQCYNEGFLQEERDNEKQALEVPIHRAQTLHFELGKMPHHCPRHRKT